MNTSIPAPIDESKDGRDFEKLVKWASAFSMAVIAGSLASLKQVNPSIELKFSAFSVLAFVAGGGLTLLFFRAVMGGDKRRRGLLIAGAGFVTLAGFFLLGIKNASPESRRDVTIGTAIAVAVLSTLGCVLWQMARYLELDDQENRDH